MSTELALDAVATPEASSPPAVPVFAGFWRRLAAFLLDGLVLGGIGMSIGLVFDEALSRMGGLERFVGFGVVLLYAGLLGSRLGGGQTLGKRVLGIQVVALDGSLLSVPAAFLRQAVFAAPFFLNGAPIAFGLEGGSLPDMALFTLLSVAIFGGMFAVIYLFVFNRATRRSLHDLAVGSCVVRECTAQPAIPAAQPWRGHLIVVATVAVLAAVLPFATQRLAEIDLFADLLPVQTAMSAEPGVLYASTNTGKSWRNGDEPVSYLSLQLQMAEPISASRDQARAQELARKALAIYPADKAPDYVVVTFVHGFNMVIASKSWSNRYQFAADELE